MAITPDTKDWTWVLERPCPECGFDASAVLRDEVPALVRAMIDDWTEVLTQPGTAERGRDDRWSPLEYACHVRDVFRVMDRRLERMLAEDGPDFDNWDQDATAAEEHYATQDPGEVASQLRESGERIAARFAAVRPDEWARTGNRGDGARFTVDSLARYFVHDPTHHLWDVRG